jgi:hypothetical protein
MHLSHNSQLTTPAPHTATDFDRPHVLQHTMLIAAGLTLSQVVTGTETLLLAVQAKGAWYKAQAQGLAKGGRLCMDEDMSSRSSPSSSTCSSMTSGTTPATCA